MEYCFKNLLQITLLVLGSTVCLAEPSALTVQQLKTYLPQGSTLAIRVTDADGKIRLQQNSDKLLAPASLMKLITAVASYYQLGPSFRFDTNLYKDANSADLIMTFSGDPLFDSAALDQLLKQAKKQGLTNIDGDLLLDGSIFRGHARANGQNWADMTHCFAAPATAIAMAHNCLQATLPLLEGPVGAKLPASLEGIIHIDGALTPVTAQQQTEQFCEPNINKESATRYRLSGCIDRALLPLKLELAAPDSLAYVKALLQGALARHGIKLSGDIRVGQLPEQYQLIAKYRSRPLEYYLQQMLQKSDNTIADVLLKTMGARYYQQPGNYKNGVSALREIIKTSTKIDLNNSNIVDGSGLSRLNLNDVKTFDRLLQHIQHMRDSTIRDALPIAGKNGTLQYRYGMENPPLKNNVRAKTGTLSGVSNMAGFIQTQAGDILNVTVFINGFHVSPTVKNGPEDDVKNADESGTKAAPPTDKQLSEIRNSMINRFYRTLFTALYEGR
ncbi:D-alanyl-D-alanine carboxypeptidase DacB [BD1-7 clade bacterium]|uniref:D-alanyl-D-alanine carboxypeptidase DacB n=1 Tax=BD1-7 clade bacterium TaxID=2029982 RepID=A0A5S9PK45_9GAMM|nr:D-alanyl-D-alanine carboxypeptidase DacB [BD1-7 clade bacterium]